MILIPISYFISSSLYYSTYAPLPRRIQFNKTILQILFPSVTYWSTYGTSPDLLFLSFYHHTNLHTYRFRIRSIYILTTAQELHISYLFLQYNIFTLIIYIYYFLHTYYKFTKIFSKLYLLLSHTDLHTVPLPISYFLFSSPYLATYTPLPNPIDLYTHYCFRISYTLHIYTVQHFYAVNLYIIFPTYLIYFWRLFLISSPCL